MVMSHFGPQVGCFKAMIVNYEAKIASTKDPVKKIHLFWKKAIDEASDMITNFLLSRLP